MDRQEYWRQRYAEVRPDWTPTTIYSRLVDELVHSGTRVLDIGCGHATLLGSTVARSQRPVGIDVNVSALTRNDVIRHRVAADAERLPFERASFLLVVMAWVLEHLPHPVPAFREIRRVLAPGGRVVFVTPNAWNYNARLIRMVPNAFHAFFTSMLCGRPAEDTYPTGYRLNSVRRTGSALARLGYEHERLILNGDPTYIAFDHLTFLLAVQLERLFDVPWLRRARVHIVGVYRTIPMGDP